VQQYVQKALDKLKAEEKRCEILPEKTQKLVMNKVEDIVITQYAEKLANSEIGGVVYLLEKDKLDHLNKMYLLFKK